MKKTIATLILFLALSGGAKAATVTLDFEDIDTGSTGAVAFLSYTDSLGVSSTWSDWGVMDPNKYNSQYISAITSPTQIAWNGYGRDASIVFDQAVNLVSGYFTSAYYSPNDITISGTYSDGTTFSFADFISLSPAGNTELVSFNLNGVTSIMFSPDVSATPENRNWFGMDDFVYEVSTPAPEPASMALGLISLTGLLGAKRRKSQQA